MSNKANVFNRDCPSHSILALIGSKWSMLILCSLRTGPRRTHELKRHLSGVSAKMLTQTVGCPTKGRVRAFGKGVQQLDAPRLLDLPRPLYGRRSFHHLLMKPENAILQRRIAALQGAAGLWVTGMYAVDVSRGQSLERGRKGHAVASTRDANSFSRSPCS